MLCNGWGGKGGMLLTSKMGPDYLLHAISPLHTNKTVFIGLSQGNKRILNGNGKVLI